MLIPVGLDLGNRRTKIHLFNKSASIPSVIGLDEPELDGRVKTFALYSRVEDKKDEVLWYGQDVLACNDFMEGLDEIKYNKTFIQRLFQAVLYEWSLKHKYDLSQLGKLNIVASMPPGLYRDTSIKRKAEKAYSDAFNTGQSHQKIRPVKGDVYQIVTQFDGLRQEAVLFGQYLSKNKTALKDKLNLVVDLGGGTTDLALFNGTGEKDENGLIKPKWTKTFNNGFIVAFNNADSINPQQIELLIYSNKNYSSGQIVSYYNGILNLVVKAIRVMPRRPDEINVIGGPAKRMPTNFQKQFKDLAADVNIRDEYVNVIANWKAAGGN